MANKKQEEQLTPEAQAQALSAAPAAQQQYSTAGLKDRQSVEDALAGAQYRESQTVRDAADALKQWQNNRPEKYQSAYQDRINDLLGQLLNRGSFQYSYTQDPLYKQYAQVYTQNAHNASADAAAQAAALTGGYGSSYAVSAAQQAYQQQIGALNNAIPTLYSLALDTYNSGGDEIAAKLDQLNEQEQGAQALYDKELSDYYTQLEQKGEAYNTAYQQDYNKYLNYLGQLDTLHGYYSEQEQTQAAQRQQVFSNLITVLGVIGDAVQMAITGTTGLGSLAGSLLNTGYGIYADNRQYEADRADAAWSQQMQERQYQSSLAQQQYKNDAAEREYQDSLAQQRFNNNVTSEKLSIAKGEWALKQSKAAQTVSRASANAAGKSSGSQSGGTASATRNGTAASASAGQNLVPYTAARLRSLGRSDNEIRTALLADGYSSTQVRNILERLNQ